MSFTVRVTVSTRYLHVHRFHWSSCPRRRPPVHSTEFCSDSYLNRVDSADSQCYEEAIFLTNLRAGEYNVVVRVTAKALEVLHALDGEPHGPAAVHRRWNAALLYMAGDALPALKPVVCLLPDDLGDQICIIDFACLLVDKQQPTRAGLAPVLPENFLEVLHVGVEHLEAYALFGDVHGRSANAQARRRLLELETRAAFVRQDRKDARERAARATGTESAGDAR